MLGFDCPICPIFYELKIWINTQVTEETFNQSSWFSRIMRLISSVVVAGSIPAFETEKKNLILLHSSSLNRCDKQ